LEPEDVDRKINKLYVKLDAATRNAQHKKVAKAAQELLGLKPEDAVATHCKLTALLQSDQVEKAQEFVSSKKHNFEGLEKEVAYCLYRNGKLSAALKKLGNAPAEDHGVLELKGQLLYRLGKVDEGIGVYRELVSLVKSGKMHPDLLANVIAAHAVAGKADEVEALLRPYKSKMLQATPEIAYNYACVAVLLEQYERATDLLGVAERVGFESFYDDDLTEEEMQTELAHVLAQKAYVMQQLGNDQEAMEMHMDTLKRAANDDVTLAVATNNLVACRGKSQIFDSMKRLEKLAKKKDGAAAGGAAPKGGKGSVGRRNSFEAGFVLAPEFEEYLNDDEKKVMTLNHVVLSILANRYDGIEQTLRHLLRSAPGTVEATILSAFVQAKHLDNLDGALAQLSEFGSRYPSEELQVQLAKCELASSCGKWKVAAEALLDTKEEVRFQPAVVGTVMDLLSRCREQQLADTFMDAVIEWWDGSMAGQSKSAVVDAEIESYVAVMKCAGSWKQRMNRLEEAGRCYEKVLEKTDDSTLRSEALAGLVQLHGVNDSSIADNYEREMPPIPGIDDLDVELLEQTSVKISKRSTAARKKSLDASSAGATTSAGGAVDPYVPKTKAQRRQDFLNTLPAARRDVVLQRQRDRRKRKRKVRLPKGYDPSNPVEPDPERWIPKRDRTNYKKSRREKRKEKNVLKGSQGAGKVDDRLDKSSAPIAPAKPALPTRSRRKGNRK